MSGAAVLFVDRDGTLIEEPDDCQVDALEKVRLVRDVIPALLRLRDAGYRFVMVTNQDGLGSPSFPAADFEGPHRHVLALFATQGIEFEQVLICPHLPDAGCGCRKPATGLLTRYLAETALDLERCAVIGDRDTDIELARRLGVRSFRVDPTRDDGRWPAIADELCLAPRRGRVRRRTRETDIDVAVALGVADPVSIATGIGFFDHMLEQIARHGGFSLTLACSGDLDVDEHHTVEDVALALGEALSGALGERRGIGRYGFSLPMDEARADVAVDLSGRPALRFEAEFPRDAVGALSTEMVRHFFLSLSTALKAAIHVRVDGDNTHHMIEACFKGVGRALKPALDIAGGGVPSTKGIL